MEFVRSVANTIQSGFFGWLIVATVLTAFELLNPRDKISLRQRAAGMSFWVVSLAGSALLIAVIAALPWPHRNGPLLTLPLAAGIAWAGPLSTLLAVIVSATIQDFFFYWYHRIQHRWLWRYHAVHHSIRDLSAVNSYHHISEVVVGMLLSLPVIVIVADVGPTLPFTGIVLYLHIVWIHSPTRFNFGPMRALFADNRFHRIHHSLEERHFDKNFGAFTTLWDRLFGTAYFPQADEWPAVGLAEVDAPQDLREWLDLPARYRASTVDTPPAPQKHLASHDGLAA